MISINASYTNLVNQRTLATNTKNLNTATERLSTGARVNHANDDAAAMFVGTSLSSNISGMKVALDNTMLASNFLNIAEGALNNVSDNLMRMNTLATQACSGIMSAEARGVLQAELEGLAEQCNATIKGATMNGVETISNTAHSADLMYSIRQKSEDELKSLGYVELTTENLTNAENDKFYINSADQLALLATKTNAGTTTSGRTFTLSADIDLGSIANWTAIGTSSKKFQGDFDGNGHIIKNMKITSETDNNGLFGQIKGSTIQNIGLENVDLKMGALSGGIVGSVDATSSATIQNCYVTGEIRGRNALGGIIGIANQTNNEAYSLTVQSCYVDATINGGSYVNVGGIAGQWQRGRAAGKIEDCYTKGMIKASATKSESGVGGIVGCTASSLINKCYSTAEVKGIGNGGTGGIIGYSNSSTVSGCWASGSVQSTSLTQGYAGGLIGDAMNVNEIMNCYSTSNVSGYNAGGLIGYLGFMGTGTKLEKSYALGNVDGINKAGALIGRYTGANTKTLSSVYYNTSALINGIATNQAVGEETDKHLTFTGLSSSGFSDSSNFSTWSTDDWDLSSLPPKIKKLDLSANYIDESEWNSSIEFQVGAGSDENSQISYENSIRLNLTNFDLSSVESSRNTLTKIQNLLTQVTQKQSYIGTQLNRLSGIATASQMTIENYNAAKSTVMDTDVAQEVANMTKAQILQQISVSVLTQSKNIEGQIALSLIK